MLAAKIGTQNEIHANIFVPNGTLHIKTKTHATGSFIAKDVIAGTKTRFHHLNGWEIPGVIYNPAPVVATKMALAQSVDEEPDASDSSIEFGLNQNYPNPFNPATTIRYTLAEATEVKLVIYNIIGQEVKVLVNSTQVEGVHGVQWDGRDTFGHIVATGMYLYRLHAGPNVAVRKMIFTK